MNCNEASALQSDVLDGELSADVHASVVAHISSCEQCTADYRKFVRTVRFVRANTGAPALYGVQGARYEEFMRSIVDERSHKDPVRVLMEQAGEGGK